MGILKISFPFFFLFSFKIVAQTSGCTDPLATNFNSLATINDGSCVYNSSTLSPVVSFTISDSIKESSGLIFWNGSLYSHNDNDDQLLYRLDTLTGIKTGTINLSSRNVDWEEIGQDANHVFVGDFGNNAGSRNNLKIYRFNKQALLLNNIVVDSIEFVYSDQSIFNPPPNTTNFDCEAFIVGADSLYLFTKQWGSNGSSFYSLPKVPGSYTANLRGTLNVQGLITGAALVENKNAVVLTGYSNALQPFLYLLYDFTGFDFLLGNKRKVELNLPFHQVEGIAHTLDSKFIISNEKFTSGPLTVPQKIHKLDLTNYLQSYLESQITERSFLNNYVLSYPVPADQFLNLESKEGLEIQLVDPYGKIVFSDWHTGKKTYSVSSLDPGVYVLRIVSSRQNFTKKLIIAH